MSDTAEDEVQPDRELMDIDTIAHIIATALYSAPDYENRHFYGERALLAIGLSQDALTSVHTQRCTDPRCRTPEVRQPAGS